jgi:hypothetical protein
MLRAMTARHPSQEAGSTAPAPRAPREWVLRVLVVAGAVALGLVLEHALSVRLAALETLSHHDVVRARAELAFLLRVVGAGLFGFTTTVGVLLMAASRRALAVGCFPPPGRWSWGGSRVVTGPRARRLARASLALAGALVICSLAGGSLLWYVAARLLACRAP